jgi:3-hydroxyisobutyrate dehydrogenase
MARHLLQSGHELVVHDCMPQAVATLSEGAVSRGDKAVISVSSPAEVVEQLAGDRSAIFTMLPTAEHVRKVFLESGSGLLPSASLASSGGDLTFVDCSTIDPGTARHISSQAAAIGSIFADAPVGGAVPGAEAGTLTFMVGCEGGPNELAHLGDAFGAMGSRVVHCGKVGSGQAAKLCNNMVLASTMASVAEAMLLGQKMGIDPRVLSEEIFNTSSVKE